MSDSTPSTSYVSASAAASERRPGASALFDELDDLLQRMLELPVHAEEDAPPASEPESKASFPGAPAGETDPAALPLPATAPLAPVSVTYQVEEPEDAVDASSFTTHQEPVNSLSAPAVAEAPEPMVAVPPQALEPDQLEQSPLLYPPPRYPLPMLPFVWTSALFDHLVGRFGFVGRWLQGTFAKTCLGILGLLLLAFAGGLLFSDWMGWTW